MSLFSKLWQKSFLPVLMHWHGDPIIYHPLDAEQIPFPICHALVGGEVVQRRRNGEDLQLVTTRPVQFVIDPCDCKFSGISRPQQNAVVVIEECQGASKYVIEKITKGDSGMALCHLILINRVAKGSKESLGE